MNEITHLHVVVEGRVQGVGFRYFVQTKAQSLNIIGWVRNTFDEKVEVHAEGDRKDLETLINLLRRGPRSAFVTDLKINWEEPHDNFTQFTIAPTV